MDEVILPPSPNWYLSNILTSTEDGTVAYGAKNSIVIARDLANKTSDISLISHAHKERVTVVAFSRVENEADPFWHCLASSGDDSIIKIWKWDPVTPLLSHNSHAEGSKISAMDWSRANHNLVISADDQGTVVIWNLFTKSTQKFYLGKLVPTCLSCCPHNSELVALGTKSGLVCVITLKGGGKVLNRLRGHDAEVSSLAWCPVPYNVVQAKETQEDMLLASGGKESSIFIWRAGSDGRYETVITLPSVPLAQDAPGSQQHRTKLGSSATGGGGSWTCVAWPEPNMLLGTSFFGELVACDLQKSLKSAKTRRWKLVHACHPRGLFCISHPPWKDKKEEIDTSGTSNGDSSEEAAATNSTEGKLEKVVWTLAQDRQIVACSLETNKIITSIPSLGGFVYCIATSPLDANRLAFGVGDGLIRVWNLSNSTSIEVTSHWQKIKGKVMALAWHPVREGWLAYGTSEGRVGLYDVSSAKMPILFHPYFRNNIYSLSWGPAGGGEEAVKHVLYACGEGEVVSYNPEKPNVEPFNLKEVFDQKLIKSQKNIKSDVAWKPDFSLLAVGNEDGTVNLLKGPNLKVIHTLFAHKKLIQCVAWHPESTAADMGYSQYQHWLAVSSNENVIKIFNIAPIIEGGENVKPIESFITLSGHLSRVVNMCWSPHIGGQLVSVSYDYTAQIWNVPSSQPIANFVLHEGHVLSCAWSPLDPDLVITGSADFTLRVWRISKQSQTLSGGKKKSFKELEGKMKTVPEDLPPADTKEPSMKKVKEKAKVSSIVNDVPPEGAELSTVKEQQVLPSQVGKAKQKRLHKGLFGKSIHQQNENHLNNCYQLLEALDGENGIQTAQLPTYLGILTDRENTHKQMDAEVEHHQSFKQFEKAQNMELWRGNVKEMLQEATRNMHLSDWLVSLAPSVSPRFWMETCKAYADQLVLNGRFVKAASYLLACHKVEEAIEMLVTYKLFREALTIARCRLAPDDPTLKKIIYAWARMCSVQGNYEVAAECMLAVGELVEAAMVIRKRGDENALKLAAQIASKAGSHELAAVLAVQCVQQALLSNNWDLANEVALQHSDRKHLKLLTIVHRTVLELEALTVLSVCPRWLQGCQHVPVPYKPIFELIKSKWQEDLDKDIYSALLQDFGSRDPPDSIEKLLYVVSVEIALSFLSSGADRLRHLVRALSICDRYRLLHLNTPGYVLHLCMWLAPEGPLRKESVFHADGDEDVSCAAKSLRAYLCAGVIDWVTETADKSADETDTSEVCQQCKSTWFALTTLLTECKNDVLTKEGVQYSQDCVKIKHCEKEIATTAAKSNQSDDNSRQQLEKLKQRKQEFETSYVLCPNPFVTYCKIKNLLQIESENGNSLLAEYEELWKNITCEQ